jgi:flagellar biosynthesis/type III secretory pathway protein FliH
MEATVNYYDKVIEQGRAEGVAAGRAEGVAAGRAEGVVDGLRAVLVKQLRLKFGALDAAVVQRIEQASTEEIDRWLERVLVADRIDAVIEP